MDPKIRRDVDTEVKNAMSRGNSLANLRELCKGYTEEELHSALVYVAGNEALRAVVVESLKSLQHRENLKSQEPHWTMVPTFCWVVASSIVSFVTLIFVILAWRYPLEPQRAKVAPPIHADNSLSPILPAPQEKSKDQDKLPLAPIVPATNSVAEPASPKE